MTNYTLVAENLYRGPRPESAGDVEKFRTVINLEVGFFEFFHGIWRREQYWCEGAGVILECYPMSDWAKPSADLLRNVVGHIREAKSVGPTLVHCAHGVDRTGMVIAAWRIIEEKWSVEQAKNEMLAAGFHKIPYFYWESVLNEI